MTYVSYECLHGLAILKLAYFTGTFNTPFYKQWLVQASFHSIISSLKSSFWVYYHREPCTNMNAISSVLPYREPPATSRNIKKISRANSVSTALGFVSNVLNCAMILVTGQRKTWWIMFPHKRGEESRHRWMHTDRAALLNLQPTRGCHGNISSYYTS